MTSAARVRKAKTAPYHSGEVISERAVFPTRSAHPGESRDP
ncbi:MAG: hypothetical protein JWP35_1015 [Caulobacter sp.]|nr:hypothetical protein [Caulobacter sp.]